MFTTIQTLIYLGTWWKRNWQCKVMYTIHKQRFTYLMQTPLIVKLHWRFDLIGLDAANIERILCLEVCDESNHRLLKARPCWFGPLGYLGNGLDALRPHLLEEGMVTGSKEGEKSRRREGGGGWQQHVVLSELLCCSIYWRPTLLQD